MPRQERSELLKQAVIESVVVEGLNCGAAATKHGCSRSWVAQVMQSPEGRVQAAAMRLALEERLWSRMGHMAERAAGVLETAMKDPRYSRSQRIAAATFIVSTLTGRGRTNQADTPADGPSPLDALGDLERASDAACGRDVAAPELPEDITVVEAPAEACA